MDVSLSKITFFASDSQPYDVYLVDTPGFDDSTRSDTDVLRNIVHWLGAMRERRIKLSGIIYLHRITDNRMGGLAWRNLRMLHNLVGADKMSNVLLVSTRWEEVRTVVLSDGKFSVSFFFLGGGCVGLLPCYSIHVMLI